MKVKPQKEITLETIKHQLANFDLKTARLNLADTVGLSIGITGEIVKVARRDDLLRLVVSTNTNKRTMLIFANFDSDLEKSKVKELKIKKGKTVSIVGKFVSFGVDAVCLSNCKLIK